MNMIHGTLVVEPVTGNGQGPEAAAAVSAPSQIETHTHEVARAVGVGPERPVGATTEVEFSIRGGGVTCPTCVRTIEAVLERWVETVRSECLDWTLILGRRHLDQVLGTYVGHYNAQRPHRGLDLAAPNAPQHDRPPASLKEICRRDVLDGLIHEYYSPAA